MGERQRALEGLKVALKRNITEKYRERNIIKDNDGIVGEIIENDKVDRLRFESIVQQVCDSVWAKFSKFNQKSPSRRNNNVHHRKVNTRNRCIVEGRSGAQLKLTNLRSFQSRSSRTAKSFYCEDDNDKSSNSLNEQECNANLEGSNSWQDEFCKTIFQTVLLVTQGITIFFYSIIALVFFYSIIVLHKPTQGFVSRNTQDLIYPLMRASRLFAIPYVKSFPYLTSLYEESCLVANPYFTMTNIDCWPCETARSIIDLTGFSNFSAAYYGSGIPFIVKDSFPLELQFETIRTILSETENLDFINRLEPQAGKEDDEDFYGVSKNAKGNLHFRWKINRVSTARMMRKYFPKPYFVPNGSEVSVQHFLFVDHPLSPAYTLPITEFANVFVTQASGTRVIALVPTRWCKSRCKVLSIMLEPKDVLFYNWLYWHPKSGPAQSSNLSVTYVGSFY